MPALKHLWRETIDAWKQVRLFVGCIEQKAYEMLRTLVLFGQTAKRSARVVGVSERTFDRKADRFDAEGMASLFDDDTRSSNNRRTGPLGDAATAL